MKDAYPHKVNAVRNDLYVGTFQSLTKKVLGQSKYTLSLSRSTRDAPFGKLW